MNKMVKNQSSQVNEIYSDLESIANGCTNGKISVNELNNKYLKYVDATVTNEVIVKLNANGLITQSSTCDSLLLQDAKRHFDANFCMSIQANGYYKYKPSNEKWIEKIVNDPDNSTSSNLFVESDNKNELGKYTIYNSTLNNSNESLRRLQATAKKNMKELNGK